MPSFGWRNLGSRKHVNLPGIRVNLPAITEKDKRDIQFAKNHGVDFIALSFVREAPTSRNCVEFLVPREKRSK